jgi:hypothetical protein
MMNSSAISWRGLVSLVSGHDPSAIIFVVLKPEMNLSEAGPHPAVHAFDRACRNRVPAGGLGQVADLGGIGG